MIREKIFGAFGPESCCSGAGVAGRQGKGQGRAGDSGAICRAGVSSPVPGSHPGPFLTSWGFPSTM